MSKGGLCVGHGTSRRGSALKAHVGGNLKQKIKKKKKFWTPLYPSRVPGLCHVLCWWRDLLGGVDGCLPLVGGVLP